MVKFVCYPKCTTCMKAKKWLEENQLFVSDVKTGWICLNCGHIYEGEKAPEYCPVCNHDKGYFVRLELSPFEDRKTVKR